MTGVAQGIPIHDRLAGSGNDVLTGHHSGF